MSSNPIFDINIHSPSLNGWTNREFVQTLNEMSRSRVTGGNLVYFPKQNQLSLHELRELCDETRKLGVIRCVDPIRESVDDVLDECIQEAVVGFKLHPRIHRHSLMDYKVWDFCSKVQDTELPIVICSWFDGTWSELRIDPTHFVELALAFPKVRFIWAHSGGLKVSEFVFNAKSLCNVYLDTSFISNYFKFGVVLDELAYGLYTTRDSKWVFGSDYPSFNFEEAKEAFDQVMERIPMTLRDVGLKLNVQFNNARNLFQNHIVFQDHNHD